MSQAEDGNRKGIEKCKKNVEGNEREREEEMKEGNANKRRKKKRE